MDFATEQRDTILEASRFISNSKDEVLALAGKLLEAIASHPSLLESTYEYDEDIQNAVNRFADKIIWTYF